MNEVLAAIQKARTVERESFLGPHSLSVIPQLVKNYAPKGMEILALASASPYRVDERGMVHFSEPVTALVREVGDTLSTREQRKVVGVTLHPLGVNGNFFIPLVTERDSDLYTNFRRYMRELVADPHWRDRPLPGRGLSKSLTESEEIMWDKWVRIEKDRNPERDTQWREQAL